MLNESLRRWVVEPPDPRRRRLRQSVHTLLDAIANTPLLQARMIFKGGMLLGIAYGSVRFTKDADFSTPLPFDRIDEQALRAELDRALVESVNRLAYGLDCKLQKWDVQPNREGRFPTLQATIGYAPIGSREHRRLQQGQAPEILPLDYSFSETAPYIDMLACDAAGEIQTYGLMTLVAEKYRALLQQSLRDRARGQDVYDLHYLLTRDAAVLDLDPRALIKTVIDKAASRDMVATRESMRDPAVAERARGPYQALVLDDAALPDFDIAFTKITRFYEALPWS